MVVPAPTALCTSNEPPPTLARSRIAAVVLESQDDVLALRGDLHRHLGRIGVLESIHDPFAGDVEHEQGDRRGQIDVLHVTLETDV
jgi:hypothetical protein